MILKKGEGAGNLKKKHYIALYGELAWKRLWNE
jgi:hypothetical protein